MSTQSRRALNIYRRVLRIARTWTATDPSQTKTEQNYIRSEARKAIEAGRQVQLLFLLYLYSQIIDNGRERDSTTV